MKQKPRYHRHVGANRGANQRDDRRGLIFALLLHGAILLALLIGLWTSTPRTPNAVQVELWMDGDAPDAGEINPPNEAKEAVEPDSPPTPSPEPEPLPEPPPAPAPAPEPEPTPPAPASAEPEIDPDIALEKARKEKQEAEAKAKAEAERKEKAEAEAKAKAEAERKAKVAAAAKAKAEADRQAKEAAFREAMRQGTPGRPGGSADRNQAGGGGGDGGYASRVRACVLPGVVYNTPARSEVRGNPTLQYRVDLTPSGNVNRVQIKRSSGIAQFDDAVAKGIAKCNPFPKPANGQYPSYIDGDYRMFE